ncbi:carboxyl-terminal-processing peptidase 1, chloroplastic-like isoform X2 [Amborella trichopoda]|uniref:carboxyl-terminal-processing peptidase 1, chloroplastic-like isoform X2 n=1 Tax=Amborella trichopoda TaxID=13333 RepID=UPI0009C14A04|nr:carboxyl-terminal-processing peptidase 1, chloroplastic-like isoform X2 [Amborella trichopoda]|eukprot:XP_020519455.1 carboxyl-terminal-processing peptidase 1, chloroplastic-like isoform X2 [Amborella trichopoda]
MAVALFHKNQGEILSGSIDTRSQAHDIIRRMLASLADPYTRFLTPSEFSKMARYDITGVGMNLRKVPNDDGSAKLKILGIVLGGPAHSAGVRQAGIEVAKRFLNQGETVIYTFGRDPQLQRSITTETAPLISAPVMVATALHDNCRAVLVGEKTFGTGLIQSVFEHDDRSGVVVTIGKYVTPSHMDINGNGIEPDFTRRPGDIFHNYMH